MSQPRVQISKKISLHPGYIFNPEIDKCEKKELNPSGSLAADIVHFKGARPFQEDTDIFFTCDFFRTLTPQQRQEIMTDTCATLNKEIDELKLPGGACAGLTMAWLEEKLAPGDAKKQRVVKTCTANAGDVSSFFAIVEKDKKVSFVKRLNTLVHAVDEAKENKELEKSLNIVKSSQENAPWRVDGLMMYRSFGDSSSSKDGHSQAIDYIEHEFLLTDTQTPYVIVGCDGLTEFVLRLNQKEVALIKAKNLIPVLEYNGLSFPVDLLLEVKPEKKADLEKTMAERFIQITLECSLHQSEMAEPNTRESNIAWHLANWGYQYSADNISVGVFNPVKTVISGNIFDGHAGKDVAEYLSKRYPLVLLDKSYQFAKRLAAEQKQSTFIFQVTEDILNLSTKLESKAKNTFQLFDKNLENLELICVQNELKNLCILAVTRNTHDRILNAMVAILLEKWMELCQMFGISHEKYDQMLEFLKKNSDNPKIKNDTNFLLTLEIARIFQRIKKEHVPVPTSLSEFPDDPSFVASVSAARKYSRSGS